MRILGEDFDGLRLIDSRRWKELQAAPDHTNMLEMWKDAGIEPIELAKYVKPRLKTAAS